MWSILLVHISSVMIHSPTVLRHPTFVGSATPALLSACMCPCTRPPIRPAVRPFRHDGDKTGASRGKEREPVRGLPGGKDISLCTLDLRRNLAGCISSVPHVQRPPFVTVVVEKRAVQRIDVFDSC